MGWFREHFLPTLEPDERQRRLDLFRTLVVIQTVAAAFIAVSGVLDSLESPRNVPVVVGFSVAAMLLTVVGYIVARRGGLTGGGVMLVAGIMVILGYFLAFYGTRGSIPFFFIWPILISSILLEPAYTLVVAVLVSLLMAGFSYSEFTQLLPIPLFQRTDTAAPGKFISFTVEVIVIYWAAALFNWMVSRSLRQTAKRLQVQVEEATAREQALQAATEELQQALAEREEKAGEAQRALEEFRRSQEEQAQLLATIRQMATPVVPVYRGVLVMPLVGMIDEVRAQMIVGALLSAVEKERAKVVILDITGVPVVDTGVAQSLLQAARAAQMVGAEAVLVGISPQVAETIVSLGVDLTSLVTRADLESGVAFALGRVSR
jgi:anti-anti-sigma regulatory factor